VGPAASPGGAPDTCPNKACLSLARLLRRRLVNRTPLIAVSLGRLGRSARPCMAATWQAPKVAVTKEEQAHVAWLALSASGPVTEVSFKRWYMVRAAAQQHFSAPFFFFLPSPLLPCPQPPPPGRLRNAHLAAPCLTREPVGAADAVGGAPARITTRAIMRRATPCRRPRTTRSASRTRRRRRPPPRSRRCCRAPRRQRRP